MSGEDIRRYTLEEIDRMIDRGEEVTIPPLADEGQWAAYQDARLAMGPGLSRRDVAERYRVSEAA